MKQNRLLLKNVQRKYKNENILIEGNRFAMLNAPDDTPADEVVDCTGLAILPAFYNAHNHAAMTLLRGYADDMPLQEWLNDHIWPYEATLKSEDYTQGSYLACLEMIKTGTVFFNDMYFDIERTIDVVNEMGMRAAIGLTMMDFLPKEAIEANFKFLENWSDPSGGRIQLAICPHAIYTVSKELFIRCADAARSNGVKLHFHLSESRQEVNDCIAAHGMSPVKLLHEWGVLGPNCIAAHVVHVDDDDVKILADTGVTVAHCPCSNMKLGSGHFRDRLMIEHGVRVAIGTDGCSSNNNLSMQEEMKFAALLAKSNSGPEVLPKKTVFTWATENGAKAFDLNAGFVEEGRLADAVLIDTNNERMVPCHHFVSNWIYSADSSCIHSVLCDGRFIMRNGHVDGEQEIIARFKHHILNR